MRKKIMIDMDDVITKGGFLYLINKYLGTNYKEDDVKEYYMQDLVPNKDKFFDWFLSKNMYDYCELLPSAKEVIKELNEAYDVFIGTSYLFKEIAHKSGYILVQKFDYLQKSLPFIKESQYIFLTDKNVLDVDIKIDDKIDNLKGNNRKLLFTAYHNKDISLEDLRRDGIERVNSWEEIRDLLLK